MKYLRVTRLFSIYHLIYDIVEGALRGAVESLGATVCLSHTELLFAAKSEVISIFIVTNAYRRSAARSSCLHCKQHSFKVISYLYNEIACKYYFPY